ncbi:hypothetical protein [Mycolicibacterium fortuitum]
MTEPVQGKFASQDDVTSRFEGTIPSDRLPWVAVRIRDAESELMGQIPSLRKSLEEITAESIAAGDPDRLNRVKLLVCEKVLDLYRHPERASQRSTTTPDITTSRSWYASDPTRGRVQFTDAELDSVRLKKRRKSKFGTVGVAPWQPTRPRPC